MPRRKRPNPFFESIEVLRAGARGKSIAQAPDGKTIMLSGAVPGDVVDVQVIKKKRNYYEGRTAAVHQYSKARVDARCKHFGVCGGCKWQNVDYAKQIEWKEREVLDHLTRIGHLDLPENQTHPILGSGEQLYYRNKLEFSFSSQRWLSPEEMASGEVFEDRRAVGFHIPGMWDKILDIEHCHLQPEPSNELRNSIREYALKNELSFFNPYDQVGLLRTMMVRTTTTGEVMLAIQFGEDDQERREALLEYLESTFPQLTSLMWTVNTKGNDAWYDLDVQCYSGTPYIMEEMPRFEGDNDPLRFKIGPKTFYQTNPKQAYLLYERARQMADLQGDELVYDLYTGTGTIAQFVAHKARHVVGVEAVEEAILAARENAERNGLSNVEFHVGDMRNVLTSEFVVTHGVPDVVITDPPRDGMHAKVVETLLAARPDRIIYVSCNSATQARDLALLKEAYDIVEVQPVDMFPHTHHVENIVSLKSKPL